MSHVLCFVINFNNRSIYKKNFTAIIIKFPFLKSMYHMLNSRKMRKKKLITAKLYIKENIIKTCLHLTVDDKNP